MSARLILPPDAPREEWLAARRKGVTASEIAVILGISPFDSPFNLFHKKTGTISKDFDNDAMSLGRHLEPWIADHWAADHPDMHLGDAGPWASVDRPWQMATPDRLIYDVAPADVECGCGPDLHNWRCGANVTAACCENCPTLPPSWRSLPASSLLEIKSSGTYDGWGEDGTDEIPPYYRAQVLWQLDTLGLTEAHVTCFFLGTRQRRDYVIPYDETDVKLMREAAQMFLEMVADGEAPSIDHAPATAQALKQLYPLDEDADDAQIPADLASDYRYAKRSLDDAQEHYDLLTNQVRALMGSAKKAMSGEEKVATRSVYEQTRVDAKQLRAEFPDAYEACRTTSTVDKLTPARRAKKDAS